MALMQVGNSFRICSYEKCTRKACRMCNYELLDLKSFRICSYKKCGGGEHQRCVVRPTLKTGDVVELGTYGLGESRQKLLAYQAAEAVYAHP